MFDGGVDQHTFFHWILIFKVTDFHYQLKTADWEINLHCTDAAAAATYSFVLLIFFQGVSQIFAHLSERLQTS